MIRSCGVMSSFEGLGRRLAIVMSLLGRSELLLSAFPNTRRSCTPVAARVGPLPSASGPPQAFYE